MFGAIELEGLISFLAVLAAIPLLCSLASKMGFFDQPGGRKRHERAIPPVGGLAIFPVFIVIVMLTGVNSSEAWFFAALILLLVTGVVDDGYSLPAWLKLAFQIIAAFLLVVPGNLRIYELGDLFGSGPLWTGWMVIPFSIISVVLMINAVNLIDGLDGLAGGLGLIIVVWLGICSFNAGSLDGESHTVVLAGALAGFLVYNLRHRFRKRASVFLGNSGSLALGLTLAWLTIGLSQGEEAVIRPISVAWLLALPIYDICGQFARRISLGRHPFDPDRHHFHHHFLYAGLSDGQATAVILGISFVMGLVGVAGIWIGIPEYYLTYIWILLLLIHIYLSMRPLRYLELLLPFRGKSIDNIIGQLILESGAIKESQLLEALEYQGRYGGKTGEILIEKGYISEPELNFFLNLQIVRNANAQVVDANRKKEFLLGEIMLASKMITNDQLREALAYQERKGGWIGQVLLNMGYISEAGLKQCLETQYSIRKKNEIRI
jgi:UDP-GlcNAc:undecaprenyl-phosphate GlcNAc-1-phosphate transferase